MARMGMVVHDGIGPRLEILAVGLAARVGMAMEAGAEAVENYAKSNAPWADDTGMARASLTAEVYTEGGEVILELAHGVDYGYWLEVIQDGQYAIIMPTLEALGPQIIEQAGGAVVLRGSY